eukprot:1904775-Pyramimonas_sp.AAC.1
MFCCSGSSAWADIIWRLVWRAIGDRGGLDNLHLHRVKAHTTRSELARGHVSHRARMGNDLADQYAKQAAEYTGVSELYRQQFK